MIAGFTILLLVLLALGLPVAFALGMGGVAGMLAFMDGESALNQLPILGYKSLDARIFSISFFSLPFLNLRFP